MIWLRSLDFASYLPGLFLATLAGVEAGQGHAEHLLFRLQRHETLIQPNGFIEDALVLVYRRCQRQVGRVGTTGQGPQRFQSLRFSGREDEELSGGPQPIAVFFMCGHPPDIGAPAPERIADDGVRP